MVHSVNVVINLYDNDDFNTSEIDGTVGAVILLLIEFKQSAILTVSYIICKVST